MREFAPDLSPAPPHAVALAQHARAAMHPRQEAYLRDLATLVNLDSGTYDRDDVERVGAWVRARCRAWDATLVEHPGGAFADSFAATLRGSGGGRVVLLAHLDTVFPSGTAAARPFRCEGDRALGPGTCDMKAGLLAGIYAIEALRAARFTRFGELVLICTTDEEIGSPSGRVFLERIAAGADAVLVLEAARENGDIVGQRRGGGTYHLDVTGRAAHAGVEPQKGRSAALALSRHVVALHALTDLNAGRTVNVGVMRAGTRPNIVPDHAEADVDLRADTLASMDLLLRATEHALAQSALDGTAYTWEPVQFRPPWQPNPGTEHLATLAGAVARSLGFVVRAAATGGTSDGNFTAAAGIPTLDGLGPIGGLDHSPLEYIDVSSVAPRTALLAGLIAAIAGAG